MNLKHIRLTLGFILVGSLFIGCCELDGTCEEETNNASFIKKDTLINTDQVELEKVNYHVPKDVTLVNTNIENSLTEMMKSGENEELAAFIQQATVSTKGTKASYKVMQKGISNAFSQLNRSPNIDNLSLLSSQNFTAPYNFTVAHYKLRTNQEIESLTLASDIVKTLSGGKAKGLPIASSTATIDTLFRFILLYGEAENSSFYIAVVVPEKSYAEYETKSNHIINAARITAKNSKVITTSNHFTQANSNQKSDFLFVVDDSGSMSDNQNALSQAADDFSNEMGVSGIAYRSAVITTSYGATNHTNGSAYRILRNKGIIENNTASLKEALIAGTYGSGTETGIYNAEQALQSKKHGNAVDGAITKIGMPENGAVLSVIIISDERSQYRNRAYKTFDINNNLFVSRNIRVYSIIQPDYNYQTTGVFDASNRSQYDDLSSVTHGIYTDINNKNSNGNLDFSTIMKKIAKDAGGTASQFTLSHPAISITSVKVNGTRLYESTTDGYTYSQSSQAIVFHGNAIPTPTAKIVVDYSYNQ